MAKCVLTILIVLLAAVPSAAQRPVKYGPVVAAYLTGLDEELNELEYQIAHNEIGRADYEKAKARLTVLRRVVERRAGRGREDAVPEYQILTESELGGLAGSPPVDPRALRPGEVVGRAWRFAGIERFGAKLSFFVFERLGLNEAARLGENGRPAPDPLSVIETIVVPVEAPPKPAPAEPQAPAPAATAATAAPAATVAPPIDSLPRVMHIYLPEYNQKALSRRIEGQVVVRALFRRDGRVVDPTIEKGIGFGLDQQAIDSVKRIGFLPLRVDGVDSDCDVRVIFNFTPARVTFFLQAGGR